MADQTTGPDELVGVVDHWYDRIGVAGIEVTGEEIRVGDMLHFVGAATDLVHVVDSMEIDHQPVAKASIGNRVGVLVGSRVRVGDEVRRLVT